MADSITIHKSNEGHFSIRYEDDGIVPKFVIRTEVMGAFKTPITTTSILTEDMASMLAEFINQKINQPER
jgi:hypothetical protein